MTLADLFLLEGKYWVQLQSTVTKPWAALCYSHKISITVETKTQLVTIQLMILYSLWYYFFYLCVLYQIKIFWLNDWLCHKLVRLLFYSARRNLNSSWRETDYSDKAFLLVRSEPRNSCGAHKSGCMLSFVISIIQTPNIKLDIKLQFY